MCHSEDKVLEEIWESYGEQLIKLHPEYRSQYLVPVLVKMIVKEREEKKYLKKRIKRAYK